MFELKKNTVEVKENDLKEGCAAVDDMNADPEIIKSFDSKEEALEELKKYKTEVHKFPSPIGSMYSVTEYYIQEVKYDEDGDWISGGDVWEISKME